MQPGTRFVIALLVLGFLTLPGFDAVVSPRTPERTLPDPAVAVPGSLAVASSSETADRPMACMFTLLARNSSNDNVYLDLYTSRVFVFQIPIYGRQLKIQNHRVAPGATMSRRYDSPGGCNAKRQWTIVYRRGSTSSRYETETDRYTRVEQRYGDRVLDLGDVGKW